MANPFKIEIEGLDKLVKDFENKANNLTKDVDDEIVAAAYDIERLAKTRVVKNFGALASSINANKTGTLSAEVNAQKGYAAYVEFGTGTLVDVPAGLEDYAIQFKGKGIRKVNLPARPFMFPSVREVAPKLAQRIKELLTK
jgi:HK97 gp10 family phage protein